MKNIILGIATLTTVLTACGNSSSDKKENNIIAQQPAVLISDTATKQAPAVAEVKAAISIKEILDNYLQIKNAFAKDNDKDAATAGNEMVKAFAGFNKAALTPDQAKVYNDVEDDAREHAEHIGMNAGKIEHQREHFDMLSKDMADLIKTFGNGGQTLYKDFCPMYNKGKGAYWISETKEIKNPYLGKAMPTCGTMKQEMK